MSRRDREIVAPLVAEINEIRRAHGGCEYTYAQMRTFCFGRRIGSRSVLVGWLTGWRDAYAEAGPLLRAAGMTIDHADAVWTSRPVCREGSKAYSAFVISLIYPPLEPQ